MRFALFRRRMARVGSFWGRRLYLAVRFPLAWLPTPPPDPRAKCGQPCGLGGMFERREGDAVIVTSIGRIYSSADPRETRADGDPTPHFVEPDDSGFCWWEAMEQVRPLLDPAAGTDVSNWGEPTSQRSLTEDEVAPYKAWAGWFDSTLSYGAWEPSGPEQETAHRLVAASSWPKATYPEVDAEHGEVTITYSIKACHPSHVRGFLADLRHALRFARRAGMRVRVYTPGVGHA